jgi:short subunit dehydrogenase-like uncharacterized protein
MTSTFLLYGANGFVGEAAARTAVESGLHPILAGRDGPKITKLANELGLESRVFDLSDARAVVSGLSGTAAVLHCAGPYIYTSKPMVDACLQTGTHYLDLTGEIPVYEAAASRDAEAKARKVMLLPGVGFDVVPTDCLALHLKQRLPGATHLALAFNSEGPAGLPPGTQKTAIEMMTYGDRVRSNGSLVTPEETVKTREVDFGKGPVLATRLTWGDVFTAYYSTGIPNIEDYIVMPETSRKQLAMLAPLRSLLKWSPLRSLVKRGVRPGPSAEERALTFMHVWGEVRDNSGHKAVARLHGPEAGVIWTVRAALAAVEKVLAGSAPAGYQTPAKAYGADFVLECSGVTREDVE